MNEDLKEYRNLWLQGAPGVPDYPELAEQLKKLRKKNRLEKIYLFTSLLIAFGLLVYLIPVDQSPYFLVAILSIGLAILMILWQVYQIRFQPLQDEQMLSNRHFLEQYVENMNRRIRLTGRYMWIYAGLIIFGVNSGYLEALKNVSFYTRLVIHLGLSLIIYIVFFKSIKKRLRKYKEEMEPLLKILEELQKIK